MCAVCEDPRFWEPVDRQSAWCTHWRCARCGSSIPESEDLEAKREEWYSPIHPGDVDRQERF